MKKALIFITAIFLAAAALAGCTMFDAINTQSAIPSVSAAELPRGAIEGGVYKNEAYELTFTAPEGWKYKTDDEISRILGAVAASAGYICDMYAADTADSCVAIECLDFAGTGADINEEKFLDTYKEEAKKLGGFEFSAYTDFNIGGNTFKAVTITSPKDNLVKYYYARRSGSYMISITAIIPQESDIGPLMAHFS